MAAPNRRPWESDCTIQQTHVLELRGAFEIRGLKRDR